MNDTVATTGTTRSNLLGAMTAIPLIAAAGPIFSLTQADLEKLQRRFGIEKVRLLRTQKRREVSAICCYNAHQFFPKAHEGQHESANFIYTTDITAQLDLSFQLLDVDLPDAWCARFIGLRATWSLAFANATGLGHNYLLMEKPSRMLHYDWNWKAASHIHRRKRPSTEGVEPSEIRTLLAALLTRLRLVTGHSATSGMLLREECDV